MKRRPWGWGELEHLRRHYRADGAAAIARRLNFKWTIGQQPTVRINQTVMVAPDGTQAVLDVTGPQPGDPSPDEIAAKTLNIRERRDESRRKGMLG